MVQVETNANRDGGLPQQGNSGKAYELAQFRLEAVTVAAHIQHELKNSLDSLADACDSGRFSVSGIKEDGRRQRTAFYMKFPRYLTILYHFSQYE
jgi:hypothetical protein